ncbi:response regulator [Pedobacter sp. SAFR-022]|uniref:response regulator n=1 Tax=Pedobacter sp. SAFR-022 TaxID=3436861 RepID=UPI003F81206F
MKGTIFVVEKDPSLLELLTLLLEEKGLRVLTASPFEDTLSAILKARPDVIILDVIRVTEEGTALCVQLNQQEATKDIPVIVLSTHPKAAQVKDVCADEVILKPFDIDELFEAVNQQLNLAASD